MSTTETGPLDISSRFAREGTTASGWLCPAPDGAGGRCFASLPCHVHDIADAHVGMLLHGGSFFVPSEQSIDHLPADAVVDPGWQGWKPVGFIRDEPEAPYVDEQLSKWLRMRVVVDPSLPPGPGWVIGNVDYLPETWEKPAPFPHPETGRLAQIAPWLTIYPDGRTFHG